MEYARSLRMTAEYALLAFVADIRKENRLLPVRLPRNSLTGVAETKAASVTSVSSCSNRHSAKHDPPKLARAVLAADQVIDAAENAVNCGDTIPILERWGIFVELEEWALAHAQPHPRMAGREPKLPKQPK